MASAEVQDDEYREPINEWHHSSARFSEEWTLFKASAVAFGSLWPLRPSPRALL